MVKRKERVRSDRENLDFCQVTALVQTIVLGLKLKGFLPVVPNWSSWWAPEFTPAPPRPSRSCHISENTHFPDARTHRITHLHSSGAIFTVYWLLLDSNDLSALGAENQSWTKSTAAFVFYQRLHNWIIWRKIHRIIISLVSSIC